MVVQREMEVSELIGQCGGRQSPTPSRPHRDRIFFRNTVFPVFNDAYTTIHQPHTVTVFSVSELGVRKTTR